MKNYVAGVTQSKRGVYLHAAVLLCLFIALACLHYYLNFFEAYQHRWGRCLQYIEEGKLYRQQPFCFEGPVTHVIVYVLLQFFGWGYLQVSSILLSVLLNFTLLLASYSILLREKANQRVLFFLYLFLLAFYPLTVNELESTMATTLLILAFYTLYYKNTKFKASIAGLFLAAAFLSKYTVAIPLVLFLVYYTLSQAIKLKNISLRHLASSFNSNKSTLLSFSLFFMVFFLLLGSGGAIPRIMVISQKSEFLPVFTSGKFIRALSGGFDGNLQLLFVYPLSTILLYSFIRYRDVYSFTASLGLIGTLVYFILNPYGPYPHTYHYMPVYYLMVIALTLLYARSSKTFAGRLFVVYLVFLLLYVHYSRVFIMLEQQYVRVIVEYGLHFIPPEAENILVEGYVSKNHVKQLLSSGHVFDVIPYGSILDMGFMNPMYNGVIDYRKIDSVAGDAYYKERILNGSYDIVLSEPPEWWSVDRIVSPTYGFLPESDYCIVDVPNLYYTSYGGRHYTILRFKNRELCNRFFRDVASYYHRFFDEVCRMDVFTANDVVRLVVGRNGLDLGKECLYGGSFIPYYQKSINNITMRDAWNLYIPVIALAVFFFYRRILETGRVSFFILLMFFILLVLLFLSYEKQRAYGGWYNKNAVVVENRILGQRGTITAQTLDSICTGNQTPQDVIPSQSRPRPSA